MVLCGGHIFDQIIDTLAVNFNFDVVRASLLIPSTKLVTSADDINFAKLNEDVKFILNRNKKDNMPKGIFVVSYTFPPEKIDIPVDFHVNINVNPTLLTSITVELMKNKNVTRLDVDTHLSYLSKSWKTNKINKFVTYNQNYAENQEVPYGIIFDSIIDNIMKKVYGEKYEEIKSGIVKPVSHESIMVSDESKLSPAELHNIVNAENRGDFIGELESDAVDLVPKNGNSELTVANPVLALNSNTNQLTFIENSADDEEEDEDEEEDQKITDPFETQDAVDNVLEERDTDTVGGAFFIGRRRYELMNFYYKS